MDSINRWCLVKRNRDKNDNNNNLFICVHMLIFYNLCWNLKQKGKLASYKDQVRGEIERPSDNKDEKKWKGLHHN